MPDTFYYSGECSNVIISADGSCSKLDMNQTLRVNDGWGTTLSHYLKSVERFEEKNIKPQENKYECQKKY